MKEPIDDIDLKILEKLDENIRIGSKQIGKEVGVQRQVIDYRIKRMESRGIIVDYRMLANLTKCGFACYYRLHVKLYSLDLQQKEEIFMFLVKHHRTVWVVQCDGKYGILAGFAAHSPFEFQDMLFEFVTAFREKIYYYDFVQVLELIVPSRDFTGIQRLRTIKGAIVGKFEQERVSPIAQKIINELAKNGRQTALRIARVIGESQEKVNYHIKTIMKSGLLFSNIQFGYNVFNFELYKTLLYLKNPSRKRIEELKKFARSYPRVWDIAETLGKWQLELDIESRGHEDYYAIMDAIEHKFSDIISGYDTLFVRREKKFLFSVFLSKRKV